MAKNITKMGKELEDLKLKGGVGMKLPVGLEGALGKGSFGDLSSPWDEGGSWVERHLAKLPLEQQLMIAKILKNQLGLLSTKEEDEEKAKKERAIQEARQKVEKAKTSLEVMKAAKELNDALLAE